MKRFASLLVLGAVFLLAAPVATATPITFVAILTGANEAPPNVSPGTGTAIVIIDAVAHTMEIHVTFGGLLGNTTASHIHCCTSVPGAGTAGVATALPSFPGFPLGVRDGTYDHIFDLTQASSWSAAFITAHGGTPLSAEADFLSAMLAGKTYYNIHSQVFPGGEIRGFLAVPEPATLALLGIALAGLGFTRRRVPEDRA